MNGNRQKLERFDDGPIRVRSLYGMTTEPIDSLSPLVRSWNDPPRVTGVSAGYVGKGYDQYQRALERETEEQECDFAGLAASCRGTFEGPEDRSTREGYGDRHDR